LVSADAVNFSGQLTLPPQPFETKPVVPDVTVDVKYHYAVDKEEDGFGVENALRVLGHNGSICLTGSSFQQRCVFWCTWDSIRGTFVAKAAST